jgi:hypothetical protein
MLKPGDWRKLAVRHVRSSPPHAAINLQVPAMAVSRWEAIHGSRGIGAGVMVAQGDCHSRCTLASAATHRVPAALHHHSPEHHQGGDDRSNSMPLPALIL